MDRKKIVILGAGGFIGNAFDLALDREQLVIANPGRADFDMGKPETFQNTDFADAMIIDCIAKIDGDKDAVLNNNYYNLRRFIDYLNKTYGTGYSYLYISSLSTLDENLVVSNNYISSKYLAEQYIKEHVKDYKLVRISFPFGKGEKPERLISRLIAKAKNKEFIELDNIDIFLTPIEVFKSDCRKLIDNSERELNYLPLDPISLEDILTIIYKVLGVSKNYSIKEKKVPSYTSKLIKYRFAEWSAEEQMKLIVTGIEKLINES